MPGSESRLQRKRLRYATRWRNESRLIVQSPSMRGRPISSQLIRRIFDRCHIVRS